MSFKVGWLLLAGTPGVLYREGLIRNTQRICQL